GRAEHSFIYERTAQHSLEPPERVDVPEATRAILEVGFQQMRGRSGPFMARAGRPPQLRNEPILVLLNRPQDLHRGRADAFVIPRKRTNIQHRGRGVQALASDDRASLWRPDGMPD